MIGNMLLSFSSFGGAFFDAFFYGFYFTIRCLSIFIKVNMGIPEYFWVFLITQLIIVGITLKTAKSKGYSIFLTFLLCLAIPLLGSLVVVLLIPKKEKEEENETEIKDNVLLQDKWFCGKCKTDNEVYLLTCKKCGNEMFDYIVKTKSSLYNSQTLTSKVITTLLEGEKVVLIEKGEKINLVNDYWVKIKSENDSIGWCYLSALTK